MITNMDDFNDEMQRNVALTDARAKAQGVTPHDRLRVAQAVCLMSLDLAHLHGLIPGDASTFAITAEMQDDEIECRAAPRALLGTCCMCVEVDAGIGQVRGIFDADASAFAPAGRGLFVASTIRAGVKFVANANSVFGAYCELAHLVSEKLH